MSVWREREGERERRERIYVVAQSKTVPPTAVFQYHREQDVREGQVQPLALLGMVHVVHVVVNEQMKGTH